MHRVGLGIYNNGLFKVSKDSFVTNVCKLYGALIAHAYIFIGVSFFMMLNPVSESDRYLHIALCLWLWRE